MIGHGELFGRAPMIWAGRFKADRIQALLYHHRHACANPATGIKMNQQWQSSMEPDDG
jgi:hypothetical protein